MIKANAKTIFSITFIATAFLLSSFFLKPGSAETEKAPQPPADLFPLKLFAGETPAEGEEAEESGETGVSYGYALYINSEEIAVSAEKGALEAMLEETAEAQARAVCRDYFTVAIKDTVDYRYGFPLHDGDEEEAREKIGGYNLSLLILAREERTSIIEYATIVIDDADKYEGEESIGSPGEIGFLEEVLAVTYDDGIRKSEIVVSSVVALPPRDRVVKKGIKLKAENPAGGLKMFIMPYDGGITSEYGTRYLLGGTFHGGVDIASKTPGGYCYGDYIKAAGDGTVISACLSGEFGNLVIIEHPNGIRTYYAHQSQLLVREGDYVKRGEYIGRIGATGQATGPHLHFEVRLPDGSGGYYRVNPKPYIIDYESHYR